jgi:hypothetical protein
MPYSLGCGCTNELTLECGLCGLIIIIRYVEAPLAHDWFCFMSSRFQFMILSPCENLPLPWLLTSVVGDSWHEGLPEHYDAFDTSLTWLPSSTSMVLQYIWSDQVIFPPFITERSYSLLIRTRLTLPEGLNFGGHN